MRTGAWHLLRGFDARRRAGRDKRPRGVPRPGDDKLLEIAVTGNADCIVTGDQDLLVLDPYCGIRILTPAAFLDAVAE